MNVERPSTPHPLNEYNGANDKRAEMYTCSAPKHVAVEYCQLLLAKGQILLVLKDVLKLLPLLVYSDNYPGSITLVFRHMLKHILMLTKAFLERPYKLFHEDQIASLDAKNINSNLNELDEVTKFFKSSS